MLLLDYEDSTTFEKQYDELNETYVEHTMYMCRLLELLSKQHPERSTRVSTFDSKSIPDISLK